MTGNLSNCGQELKNVANGSASKLYEGLSAEVKISKMSEFIGRLSNQLAELYVGLGYPNSVEESMESNKALLESIRKETESIKNLIQEEYKIKFSENRD